SYTAEQACKERGPIGRKNQKKIGAPTLFEEHIYREHGDSPPTKPMATGQMSSILHHLRRAAFLQDAAEMTDGQLLERFLLRLEDVVFESLVRRHGPMVLGVCRRVLRNAHDAEDAFQATFLVLVRKATSLQLRGTIGNWLYGVAYHTALKARATLARQRTK